MTGLITQLSQSQWSMMSSTNGGGPVGVLVPQTFISVCICTVYSCVFVRCVLCVSVCISVNLSCVHCVYFVCICQMCPPAERRSLGGCWPISLIWFENSSSVSILSLFILSSRRKKNSEIKWNWKPENPNRHFSCLFNISSVICLLTFSLCPKVKTLYLHNVKFPGNFEVNSADYTHVILLFIQQSTN